MAAQTKGRELWTEEESHTTTIRQSNPLKLSRVFRFVDPQTNASQISDFPDSPPTGDTPLEVRMKHFTEVENFTFLAYILAHELGWPEPMPVSKLAGLSVPDAEFQNLVNAAHGDLLTDEDLGDTVLDVGINWEHFIASTDALMTAADPLKITDAAMQAKIDSLDLITEALVDEVNARSLARSAITVSVSTVASGGQPITGYYVSLWEGGALVADGFSPCSFTVLRRVYQVAASDYGQEGFARRQDGSTGRVLALGLTPAAPGAAAHPTP